MLTNVYCIFIMVYYIYDRKGGDDENGPKQMCLASFGPLVSFFSFFPSFFQILTNVYKIYIL